MTPEKLRALLGKPPATGVDRMEVRVEGDTEGEPVSVVTLGEIQTSAEDSMQQILADTQHYVDEQGERVRFALRWMKGDLCRKLVVHAVDPDGAAHRAGDAAAPTLVRELLAQNKYLTGEVIRAVKAGQEGMRQAVETLGAQNAALARIVGDLQKEVIATSALASAAADDGEDDRPTSEESAAKAAMYRRIGDNVGPLLKSLVSVLTEEDEDVAPAVGAGASADEH